MPVLTESELASALADLSHWEGDAAALHRSAEFPTFPAAIDAVTAVAAVAEAMDHHPDIDIRWRTLTFHVSSHSEGGVTAKDVMLAGRIDDIVGDAG